MSLYAGVELGGTKCIAILASGPDDVLERHAVPTTTPDETLGSLAGMLETWHSRYGIEALGIGGFGPLDLDPKSPRFGQIASTPKAKWRGADVLAPLQRAASAPAVLDTDVNGAALAEMRWGSGRGFGDFAYVTVGTGVGVGLIVNGRPTRGFGHCELGHVRVARRPGDDFSGSCPYHGDCVEGLAAGPSIEARAQGRPLAELAIDDPLWTNVSWALAQLCHAIVCAAAPRAVAMGGGVIARQPHLLQRVNALLLDSLNGYVGLPEGEPYVRAPALGSDAGPLGAIALAMTA